MADDESVEAINEKAKLLHVEDDVRGILVAATGPLTVSMITTRLATDKPTHYAADYIGPASTEQVQVAADRLVELEEASVSGGEYRATEKLRRMLS